MSNLDPQIAAEFAALERLRLAVSQYRAEAGELRKRRGLESPSLVPLVDLEDLPEEFVVLAKAARQSVFGLGDSPLVAPPVVAAPVPVVAPVVTPIAAPVAAPVSPVAVAPVVPPVPVVPSFRPPTPPVSPALPLSALAPAIPAPQTPTSVKAVVIAPDEPDEFTGETQDIRVKTSPFAPITPAKPMPQVRVEAGLAAKAEPLARGAEAPVEQKTQPPLSADAQASPRINLPAATPSAMMRRPGMSPSMQIETLGSFLRRFRLAGE